jgi:hypothetical protein
MKKGFLTHSFLPTAMLPLLLAFSSVTGAQQQPDVATANTPSASNPKITYWNKPETKNVMRLEEWPNGELRFWAHQIDPKDEQARRYLAKYGLEIPLHQMTPEYMLRFCEIGYANGIKTVEIKSKSGDATFVADVSIGFDYFRGVDNPKYGNTRWEVKIERVNESKLHFEGKLTGWRGRFTFGLVHEAVDLVKVEQSDPCKPSRIYNIKAPKAPAPLLTLEKR